MVKRNLNDLLYFVTVAREGSFTRAASLLGVTQSALSQAISGLEARLGIRLLTRTTRSVSPTAAGERLLDAIGRRFDEIDAELDALSEMRDKPAGTVRITCGEHVLRTTLLPKLTPLLREYPDIKVEFDINYGFRDIVADRFDAGVRLGDTIDKDMIAMPIGPRLRMAAAASPEYFAVHPKPRTPRELVNHNCINMRMQTAGGLYVWDFERRGQPLNVRVDGSSSSTRRPAWWMQRWWGWASRSCLKRSSHRTLRMAGWCACWRTGARRSPATTCTTRAAGSLRPRFRWWSMRCAWRPHQVPNGVRPARPGQARPARFWPCLTACQRLACGVIDTAIASV